MGAIANSPRQRPWLVRLLDERDVTGGALKAFFVLCHAGPSLLVTAVTVGAAGVLACGAPSFATWLRIVLVVLPAQLATGAANDIADRDADAVAKPHKPLVRRGVPSRLAWGVVAAGIAVPIAVAATVGPAAVAAVSLGLGAGIGYDARLKRSPVAVLAWWAGFCAVPLAAASVAGVGSWRLLWVVPLALPLSLSLHVANALPDLAADRAAGVHSTAVALGAHAAAAGVAAVALAAAGAVALPPGRAPTAAIWLTAGVHALTGLAALGRAALGPGGWRRPFPPLALTGAALAVAWLAAVP